jgi:endonuclease YncB( thermonuclease family)
VKGAFVFALAVGFAAPVVAACPEKGAGGGLVSAALDAATLRLNDGSPVRLAGVEAPRRPLELDADAPWPAGESGRAALERLAVGKAVTLAETGDGPDRYGRRHAYVFLEDGRSLARLLLAEGAVRARWLPGESDCFPSFLGTEGKARAARTGLWALPEFDARSADDPSLNARNGLYDLVEGRVVSVGHGSRMIFLDFGHDYRRDFTVMVPPKVAEALAASGRDADSFSGRRVLVRGLIEESNGPAIRLNDPAEIDVLDE